MKERSLILFTLLAQMAVGAFWALGGLHFWIDRLAGPYLADMLTDNLLLAIGLLVFISMLASLYHLGSPEIAWRAVTNWRSSWLSREILFTALFAGVVGGFALLQWFRVGPFWVRELLAGAAALVGLALVYSMGRVYLLRTVPTWNNWTTPVSFFLTMFLLGALAVGAGFIAVFSRLPEGQAFVLATRYHVPQFTLSIIPLVSLLLLEAELIMIPVWVAQLAAEPEAAYQAFYRLIHKHRLAFGLRLGCMLAGAVLLTCMLSPWGNRQSLLEPGIWIVFCLVVVAEIEGRALFYESQVRLGVSNSIIQNEHNH